MKKLLLLLAILFLGIGVFSSCNKPNGGSNSSLIGTWKAIKDVVYSVDGSILHSYTATDLEFETLTITESSLCFTTNGKELWCAYTYDKDSQRIYFGMRCYIVKKLTANELVTVEEHNYNEYGYTEHTFQKVN